eukprot:TRINITY_DN3133_c0_g1_i1.p2 TRINITY_DN3133_c0_g1~~TRINITY_DN3133_c0_g1_i1.p2  ORF type:complete len:697 (-),score=270.08 TRINITY_DN3133_c0_g1_i1:97-2187(-)
MSSFEASLRESSLNKTMNAAAPSKLKVPSSKAVLATSNKENSANALGSTETASTLKRKVSSEAILREKLNERKAMNSTLGTSSLRTNLNATISAPASKVRKVTPVTTTLSRAPAVKTSTTTSTVRKPAVVKASAASSSEGNRADWDVQGRLADNEKMMKMLLSKLEQNESELANREQTITKINEVKGTLEIDVEGRTKELQQVYTEKLDLQNQMVNMQSEHNIRVQSMLLKYQSLESTHNMTSSQLNMSKAENESLKLTIEGQTGQISNFTTEVFTLKSNLKNAQESCTEKEAKIQQLLREIDENKTKIAELEAQVREDETLRKKLHNTIQELKGNIRVFCRVRPYLGDEIKEFNGNMEHYEFQNDKSLDINTSVMSGITGKTDGKKFNFGFDKVFQPQSSQSAVFDEISQLVQSALDGYNTCIFAYGQTGSGKTYTMEGPGISSEIDFPIVDSKCKGMIPRAVEQIWISAEALKDKGWTYEMEAMYIEIYNESIKDLLAKKQVSEDTKYDIKHDAKGNTTITNATTIKVRSPTQVYELLSRASHNRSVGRTDMNERSSRSHSVFQLKLVGTNSITTESISGLLNLIDLAGSERLNQSGATGQRLKETQHINKSLTHLGDVIAALANKESHIPYRNSKLTYLLQNSLGGNSKTLMFVNISPRVSDLNETISSLRFATKVNACEIGTAKKQNKTDLK